MTRECERVGTIAARARPHATRGRAPPTARGPRAALVPRSGDHRRARRQATWRRGWKRRAGGAARQVRPAPELALVRLQHWMERWVQSPPALWRAELAAQP